jgi:hypothetical protein
MPSFLDLLKQAGAQILQDAFNVVVPVLLSWFQQHVLPHNTGLQALPKEQLRATARQWVTDMLTEIGTKLVAKGLVPALVQPFVPLAEAALAQALDAALDAAGM